jgi:hypothetical protein
MLEQLIHKEAIAFEAVVVQSWTREVLWPWMTTQFSIPFWFCGWYNLRARGETYMKRSKADSQVFSSRKFK